MKITRYKIKPQGIETKNLNVPACKNPPIIETDAPKNKEAIRLINFSDI